MRKTVVPVVAEYTDPGPTGWLGSAGRGLWSARRGTARRARGRCRGRPSEPAALAAENESTRRSAKSARSSIDDALSRRARSLRPPADTTYRIRFPRPVVGPADAADPFPHSLGLRAHVEARDGCSPAVDGQQRGEHAQRRRLPCSSGRGEPPRPCLTAMLMPRTASRCSFGCGRNSPAQAVGRDHRFHGGLLLGGMGVNERGLAGQESQPVRIGVAGRVGAEFRESGQPPSGRMPLGDAVGVLVDVAPEVEAFECPVLDVLGGAVRRTRSSPSRWVTRNSSSTQNSAEPAPSARAHAVACVCASPSGAPGRARSWATTSSAGARA